MFSVRKLDKAKRLTWDLLRSPKTVAFLKLGAAIVGVIHAIEELRDSSKSGKNQIGFKPDED